MRCPNCGFESEDNFCQICGIEIPEAGEIKEINKEEKAEEALPEIITTQQSARRKPKLKKILISALCIMLGTAFVSASSIGIYAYLTKPDDRMFFHTVGQEINCGSFSITMTGTPKPTGELLKYNVTYYVDDEGNIFYDEYELEAYDLEYNDVTPVKEQYYKINVIYPIEFTIKNHTSTDMEFTMPDVYPSTDVATPSMMYSSSAYYGDIYTDSGLDIAEKNSKGHIEVPAYSDITLTKMLICNEYYYETYELPDSILSQIEGKENQITDNEEPEDSTVFDGTIAEKYELDSIDDIEIPKCLYMTCSFDDVTDKKISYNWPKFYAEYPS